MKKAVEYIFVDLDGTLIKTDALFESALKFVLRNPLNVFLLACWLMKGRSVMKHHIAARVALDVSSLPFETELLDYLALKKKQGYKLILATAAHLVYAIQVADHLAIFDDIIATDENNNMKGGRKLDAIRAYVGSDNFCYAGDSNADRPIWKAAAENIFVNAPSSAIKDAQDRGKDIMVFKTRTRTVLGAFIDEMRLLHWAKNILVFCPLLISQQYWDAVTLSSALIAFVCFSICASGVYFMNDLVDLDVDRAHEAKKQRPLAAGELSLPLGVFGAVFFLMVALIISGVLLPSSFVVVLIVYFLINLLYSFYLKNIAVVGLLARGLLYCLRIFAGAAATGIIVTF